MAIGSGAEIGIVFGRWGDMTPAQQDEWCRTFRDRFGADLMKGYATVDYPKGRTKNYGMHKMSGLQDDPEGQHEGMAEGGRTGSPAPGDGSRVQPVEP